MCFGHIFNICVGFAGVLAGFAAFWKMKNGW
jgi:hypothetical protein